MRSTCVPIFFVFVHHKLTTRTPAANLRFANPLLSVASNSDDLHKVVVALHFVPLEYDHVHVSVAFACLMPSSSKYAQKMQEPETPEY